MYYKKVNFLLEQAGYFEERNVDISAILHMYEECGYHYSDKQKLFIEKYAYLEIHYIHPGWKQDVVEEYNEFLQDDLLIIGDIEKENMTLFLSEKGFYFTAYDDCLINWGEDFEIMISKLLSGEKGELQIIQ